MAANKFTYWNEVWETNVDVGNNRSIIHCKVHVKANGIGWQTGKSFSGNVNIGGNNHAFSWGPGNGTFPYGSYNEVVIAEFADWIGHAQDGSLAVSVSSNYNASGSYSPGTCSASNTFYGTKIPRQANITGADSFNDEQNPVVYYNNPAGNYATSLQTCISWTGGDDIAYRDVSKTGNSYTYNFTEAERTKLRHACKNSNSMQVKFYIRTVIGGNTFYSTADRTLTVINANPTINPTVVDTKATTIALTGNSNTLVRYESNAKAVMDPSTKKYATISETTITNSGIISKASENVFSKINNGEFDFYLKDSRGNSISQKINKTTIPYLLPSCNIFAKNPTADGRLTIRIQGNCFKGSFGKVANTINLQYRRKEGYNEYGPWENVVVTLREDNTYDTEIRLTNLDYRKAYTFQAQITDKLHNVLSNEKRVKTTPVFEWNEDTFNINGKLCINGSPIGDGLPIGAMIPFGSEQNVPNGWRICDGSAILRTTYKKLFDVIGTSYGAGDGSTTFNLPDKRGRVSIGKDSSTEFNIIGKKGGGNGHHHIYGYSFGEFYGDTIMKDEQAQHNVGAYDGISMNWAAPKISGQTYCNVNNGYSTSLNGKTVSRYEVKTRTSNESDLPPYEIDIWIIKVSNENGELSQEKAGTIIDNLTSTSTTDALSANMGRELLALSNKKFESYQNKNIFWNNVSKWGAWYPELSKIKNDNLTTFVENKITFKKAGNYLILATISYEYPGITGMLMNKNGQYVCDNLVSSNGMWSTSGQYTGFFNENDTLQVGMYSDQQGSACHRRTFIDIIEL